MSNSKSENLFPNEQPVMPDGWADKLLVVKVALPVPLRQLFDYFLPAALPQPTPGCRVKVGFGRRTMTGLVVNVCDSSHISKEKIKPIIDVLDSEPLLGSRHLDFLRWVADYYIHPVGEVYMSALPKLLRNGKPLKLPEAPYWKITDSGQAVLTQGPGRARVQHSLLQILSEAKNALGAESLKVVSNSWRSAICALQEKGLVEKVGKPDADEEAGQPALKASDDQQQAIEKITASLNS
jgi:primosomal protein N' (replication factor Y)